MKNTLHLLLIIALAVLVIYQSFVQEKVLKEAQHLSIRMETHLDTLQQISNRYTMSHQRYVELHRRLLHTQKRASHLSEELTVIANDRQAELQDIYRALHGLIAYDRQQLLVPDPSIDSLLFRP